MKGKSVYTDRRSRRPWRNGRAAEASNDGLPWPEITASACQGIPRLGCHISNQPHTMPDQIDWTAAAKYLAGEGSASERAKFEAWLSENPDRAALVSPLASAFSSSQAPAVDVDAAWSKLRGEMEKSPVVAKERGRILSLVPGIWSAPRHKSRRAYWALPALAAAGLAAVLLPRAWKEAFPPSASVSEFRTVATAAGERKSLTLDDGISVLLGPSTSLDIERAAGGKRRMSLNGEAYFTVRHDPRRRLSVRTASALIEDIGTEFNVRSVAGVPRTEVSVVEGIVALRSARGASAPLELRAGSSGIVDADAPPRLSPGSERRDALAWTRGELVFRGTRMSEVALELDRWYGLQVSLSDPALGARTLSARFAGESGDTVVRVIAQTLGISYQLHDRRVTFSPGAR